MKKFTTLALIVIAGSTAAKEMNIKVYSTDNKTPIGHVKVTESKYGLLFTPQLSSLTPGLHGFHVHENHKCSQKGMDAGGHYDPKKTGKHLGPYGDGHLGDLPALYVDKAGEAHHPVLAPRLSFKDIKQKALMVHQNGDNYSDHPKPMGGGGERIACGLID